MNKTICSLLFLFHISALACQGLLIDEKSLKEIVEALRMRLPQSSYSIEARQVDELTQELKISKEQFYFAVSVYASQRGAQPISEFPVGAAAIATDGTVILGANIEFPGTNLGLSFHAERTAMILAHEEGKMLRELYSTVTPCGGCRQWLNEILDGPKLKITLKNQNGLYSTNLSALLPSDFGPRHLGQIGMLDGQMKRWIVLNPTDGLEQLNGALARSYAPYSNQPSGALLVLKSGQAISGSYVEQAAFEAYSAFAVALTKMIMLGMKDASMIAQVLVVSPANEISKVNHRSSIIAHAESIGLPREAITFFSHYQVIPNKN